MIITTRFVVLLAIGAVPLAVSGMLPVAAWFALAYLGAVITAGIADYLTSPEKSSVEVRRASEDKLSLGTANPVTLYVRNRTRYRIDATVRDEPPYLFNIEGNVASLKLSPREEREMVYHITPHTRGDYRFGDIYMRIKGPLGLVVRQHRVPASQPVKVYPNLMDLRKLDLMIRRGRTKQAGMRRMNLYGRGTEFESLRDYSPDDEFRQVDWKATAKRGRLTSRQYQMERSQNVIILLDAGRAMCVRVDSMTKLDYAINATLMLAYAVTSGDDKVGLLTFSRQVDCFIPPDNGRSQALSVMKALYNVPLTTEESDYSGAFHYLARRWRKRSLVVVFSDLLDPESSRQIIQNLRILASRHLCMCVAISDPSVLATARAVPDEPVQMYQKAAAVEVLRERDQAVAALERAGVVVVDAEPGMLSPEVVNSYLKIKTQVLL